MKGPKPIKPSNVAVARLSSTSARVSWTDNSSFETGFQIQRKLAGGAWSTVVAVVVADTTTYDDATLTASVGAEYRVRSVTLSTYSAYSTAAVLTGEDADDPDTEPPPTPPPPVPTPVPSVPAAPTGVTITAGDAQVSLTWQASTGAVDYLVRQSTVSGGPYTLVKTVSAGLSTTVTGLVNGTIYYFVIAARNTGGTGENSSQVSATPAGLPASPAIPSAPTNLMATAGDSQVALTWTAASGASTYTVKRGSVSGGPYSAIGTTAGVAFTDSLAVNGNLYYYVVASNNVSGSSANSSQVSGAPTGGAPGVTLASYTVHSIGWVRCGMVFPEGAVPSPDGVVFDGIGTQNLVLKRWADNSIKHVLVTAKFTTTGVKSVVTGAALGGTFTATAPTITCEATPDGGATRTATFTDTTYANARENGPLCKETRQVLSFTSATGALAKCFVHVLLTSFNDGTHRVAFMTDNSQMHADSAAVVATIVRKINGSAVKTDTATVTTGPGTVSHVGGLHLTFTQAHGLSKGDYIRAFDVDGDPSYVKVWRVDSATAITGYNGFNPNVGLSGTAWAKVTYLLPWGARDIQRFLVSSHVEATWTPDLEPFFEAQAIYRPHAAYVGKTYSQTMLLADSNVGGKTYSAEDFGSYAYGIHKPFIALGGQRPELGIMPEWVLQWTKEKTQALYTWMKLHADLAANASFHITKANGEAEKLSDNPTFYYLSGGWLGDTEKSIIINPELGSNGQAHQGGYFFVPYLVTGDWLLQDELIHHAAFGVRNQGSYLSGRGDGSGYLFLMANGLRSAAWTITKLAECIAILPSTESAWVTEFETIIANNNTREDAYVALEPDSVLAHSIISHERLLYGNTTTLVNPPDRSALSRDGLLTDQLLMQSYLVIASDHCRRLGVTSFADYRQRIESFWVRFVNQVDAPRKALYAFQFYGMPWMTNGGPILTHASMQACLDYNELNLSGVWGSTPVFNGGADYSMYLRNVLRSAVRDGVSGASTAANLMEGWSDSGGNHTTRWTVTGEWSYGLSNFAFAFPASEGYR